MKTKTIILSTNLVIKIFKQTNKKLTNVNFNLIKTTPEWLSTFSQSFELTTINHNQFTLSKKELHNYQANLFNKHQHYFKTLFHKANQRFIIIFILVLTLSFGLGIGGWQIYKHLNSGPTHLDHRININNDGGDYYKAQGIIQNTSSNQLRSAVQHIPNLNPNLQSAINDQMTILSTSDSLQYDGGYHLMKININANNSEIFKGSTIITMNIKANKFDISMLDGDFTHDNTLHIANIDSVSLLNALKLLPNLNPNLASALRETGIQVNNINGKVINDGQPHLITFTLDANNTSDFTGQLNCQLKLTSDKFDISNLKNDYTSSPPGKITDTSFNSLVYLITSVSNMASQLIAVVQDSHVILTTTSPLPNDGESHLFKVTINANNTLAYTGQLTVTLKAIAGKMDINSLSQDLTAKPPVVEQNTNPTSLRDALQKVQGINQTTLNVLKESNLLISTHSNLPDDGLPHEIDINLNAYKTLDYTGTATIKLMTKTIKTDITNDGGNYTSYGNIISNSVDSPALIKALKQIKQTNPVILSAINDPKVIVSTTSKLPQDDLTHDIVITVDASQAVDYSGVATILVAMVYPKTDITNWNQDLTSSPSIVEPDLNSNELLDALTKVVGLNPALKNILTLSGVTITTNSKLIYDNAPHPVDIIINANNTEHYKGQAKITLLVVATTIDLSYFSGDYSQDGSYAINGTSQAQLITAINSDTKMNPVIKTAVNTKGIIVATTTKILPNNQPTIAQITIDGTNTKTYFGKAIIKLTVKNNANDPFTIKIGIIKSDSFNGTSSSWYYSQSENFVDYLDYADSMDSFAKKYPTTTINISGDFYAWKEKKYLSVVTVPTSTIIANHANWFIDLKVGGYFVSAQQLIEFTFGIYNNYYDSSQHHNLYWQYTINEYSTTCDEGVSYNLNIDSISFSS